MHRPVLVAFVVAAAATAGPAFAQGVAPHAHDSVFGSFFSRAAGPAQAASPEDAGRGLQTRAAEAREREARDIRRGYWERERARLAGQSTARTVEAATR